MATPKQEQARLDYFNVMTEVKVRIDAINAGTNGKLGLPAPIVREFCYLQMRMICELVALGCLIAHGDIEETRSNKLQGEYNAHRIIDRLGELHPDFFPKPIRTKHRVVGKFIQFDDGPAITQKDLIELYHECGEVLHRGRLKKLLKQKSPVQVHYPDITKKAQKLADLLSIHVVRMIGGQMVFLCQLQTSDTGLLNVVIAEARTPPEDIEAEFQDYQSRQ